MPEGDPTTLFTGSGMQPMIPYLLGEKHPLGTRIVNSQRSFRAEDIEEVGDNRHTTFFEMLGNWSFGDYFRSEQLRWMSEFLFDEVGIDPKKLYVTTFIGDTKNGLERDTESAELWKAIFKERGIEANIVEIGSEAAGSDVGMQGGRIFYYDSKKNWWSRAGTPDKMPIGEPGGPDSEMFYEFTEIEHDPKFGKECHPNCDCGRYLEIGNNVFMTYKKAGEGVFEPLPSKNVDFGGGLERMASASQNDPDIFKIDAFIDTIARLEKLSGKKYEDPLHQKSFRIIADHARAANMLIADGVRPSNTEQGYVLRRLLRRAIFHADKIGVTPGTLFTSDVEKEEEVRFRTTLARGLKEFEKGERDAFILFTTYGFPFEMTQELALEKGETVDEKDFKNKIKEHQEKSRSGAEQKFKGGLADTSEKTVRLHTATHLLNAALKHVLGEHVKQKGSNITEERLRFDFSHPTKLTDEEKQKIGEFVNNAIAQGLPVVRKEMPRAEAESIGAEMEFNAKYPDTVSIYFVGDEKTPVSKEFCGGPHVTNTKELGIFKIVKEEASSAGVRRIKAILE